MVLNFGFPGIVEPRPYDKGFDLGGTAVSKREHTFAYLVYKLLQIYFLKLYSRIAIFFNQNLQVNLNNCVGWQKCNRSHFLT